MPGRLDEPCFVCSRDEIAPSRRDMLCIPLGALAAVSAPQTATAQTRPRPPEKAFVIAAGCALLEEGGELRIRAGVNILVRDGVIAEISDREIKGFPVVDAHGDLALPGFISGHTHCASATPTRGIIEGGRFYGGPFLLVEQLSDDDLDDLTAFNLAELLRSGCTCQVEMSRSLRQAESYVRIAKKWGVRGYPCPMVPGASRLFPISMRENDDVLFQSEDGTLAEIDAAVAFGKRHMNTGGGLIRPMIAAHATDTHTDRTMQALKKACGELGTGLQIHLAQGARETEVVKKLWKMTPAQWLESHGLLDQPVFGAHMSGVDWAVDAPLLKKRGVVYAHCPSGGGAGGSSQPYPEALAAGVATNIGIDTHSNDYLENLKLAVLYGQDRAILLRATSKVPLHSPTVVDAIDGATRVAARGLRREDIGRLVVGAQADIVTVDVSGFLSGSGAVPPEPLHNLLYSNGRMVRHVMTAGLIQIYDGQLACADEDDVIARGGAVVKKIWAELEKQNWFGDLMPRRG